MADSKKKSKEVSFLDLIKSVEERCKKAKIEIEIDEDDIFEEGASVCFPEKDSTRSITLVDEEDAEALLKVDFEHFEFLEGYDAYYDKETNDVYAAIASAAPYRIKASSAPGRRKLARGLLKTISPNSKATPPGENNFELESGTTSGEKISISRMLPAQDLLTGWGGRYNLSLQISGRRHSGHDDIKDHLEELTNSLFLQIEAKTGSAMCLVRSKKGGAGYVNKTKRLRQPPSYTFPKIKYDRTAMTFYWYGVGAYGMPLMQYLAFYQAIEHFYPKHSNQAVIREVQSALKQPGFNPDRDKDIVRLLKRVPASGGHGGYGNELAQLKATLKDCVNEEELKAFLKNNNGEKKVYSSTVLHQYKINPESKDPNFLGNLAKRVYDIRCRIVHTKMSDDEGAPILPYTKEENYLKHDTALVKFLALQVIVYNASGR